MILRAHAQAKASKLLRRSPYVIVGGGAQGLTFALSLAFEGLPVVLFERSGVLGGQARSFRYADFVFDFGLHAFVTKTPRVERFARRVLGRDFSSFYPRAASHCGGPGMFEDASYWRTQSLHKRLYSLLPRAEGAEWSCMRVSRPPEVIYPRRGGFGAIFERMGELLRENGGAVLLGTGLEPRRFAFRSRRLEAITLGGRRFPVRGCYWSAGRPFSAQAEPRNPGEASGPRDVLLLHHILARGRAPQPYHWVRLPESRNPLLPPLAYYPSHFSRHNAPPGHYSIGTTTPILTSIQGKRLGALGQWVMADPKAFLKPTMNYLADLGLLRSTDVIGAFSEAVALPPAPRKPARPGLRRFENFWDAADYPVHGAEESGVSVQMESAFAALDCALAAPSAA